MPYIITNTQTALKQKPKQITPEIRCYLSVANTWTVVHPARTFESEQEADLFLRQMGLTAGEYTHTEKNIRNVVAIEAAS